MCYVKHLLDEEKDSPNQKTAFASGSGDVAICVIEKVQELGGKVVTYLGFSGYIHDSERIDVKLLKKVEEISRRRLTECANQCPPAVYRIGESVWTLKERADIALSCAIQSEIDGSLTEILVESGIKTVAEGANMSCTARAVSVLHEAGVWYYSGKAANAGGVAVSALEMSQDVQRLIQERKRVDEQLDQIMETIYHTYRQTTVEYSDEKNLLLGANVAGFEKITKAMAVEGLA